MESARDPGRSGGGAAGPRPPRYRARDLLLVPGLLSLARLPLAAVFPLTVERPALALGVLTAAAVTDVLDGWYARRFGQSTPTGAAIDPITDKLFVLSVMISLVVERRLGPLAVLALSTREIGELPLLVWFFARRREHRQRKDHPIANAPGKLATSLQFLSVAAALFGSSAVDELLVATAAAGGLAAASYWWRELGRKAGASNAPAP